MADDFHLPNFLIVSTEMPISSRSDACPAQSPCTEYRSLSMRLNFISFLSIFLSVPGKLGTCH